MKLSVEVEGFTPKSSNTLRGFATIVVPGLRLRIHDVSVHERDGRRWVGLPGKPLLDRDGGARRGDDGKIVYAPVLEFTDRPTRNAFSAKVIAALLEFAPSAFEPEEAA